MHINTLHLEGFPVDFILHVALEIINSFSPGFTTAQSESIFPKVWLSIYDSNGNFIGQVYHDMFSEKRSITFFAHVRDENNTLDFSKYLFNFCIYY